MRYPKHYPAQCPPADAAETSGTFYRLIKGDTPEPDEFLPFWLTKGAESQKRWKKNGKDCVSCGLSISANIGNLKDRISPSTRYRKIVKVTLDAGMGKIKSTPNHTDASHHTWWVPVSIKDPSGYFKVVA